MKWLEGETLVFLTLSRGTSYRSLSVPSRQVISCILPPHGRTQLKGKQVTNMALRTGAAWSTALLPRIRFSDEGRSTADAFAPLAAVFRRRLLVGTGTASLVAIGANFVGITSFLLGISPELGRGLKLDALYPIQGYCRCLEIAQGFEFIYPANWVGDQTLLYRAVGKAESQRQLDPPPLANERSRRTRNISEPTVAFGPPGSDGELNVSVVVSPVPPGFSIEAFGGAKEVGEAVMRTVAGSKRGPSVKATLAGSAMRKDPLREVNYYELEFTVESPSFSRHNVAVCCAYRDKLFTLNAQSPESAWPTMKEEFYKIADSFNLTFSA